MTRARPPVPESCVGAVLAGGAGRRIGGDKAGVVVAGRPLVRWPLDAVRRVCDPVAVVARPDTSLPLLDDPPTTVWREDACAPRHPLSGVVHALRVAAGRPVLVCAGDLALLDVATLHILLTAAALAPEAAVVAPEAGGRLQVLCAVYRPAALAGLEGFAADARVTDVVGALDPAVVPFADAAPFFNVNTPADAERAGALLAARSGTTGWPTRR